MKLIVGLGNPGEKYAKTRHNLGFMVVDQLGDVGNLRDVRWKKEEKFSAEICRISDEIFLIKPQTFMNGSGEAVVKIARFYKVEPQNIWVIHDDVDISLGKLKIRMGGSGAGHHGVESIIESLGTDKFLRFRLGIGRPQNKQDQEVEQYVLKEFGSHEKTLMEHLLKRVLEAVKISLQDGPQEAMNRYNR